MPDSTKPDGAELGLLYSGGLDSGILLAHLLDRNYQVQPIYIESGLCWQGAELSAARQFLERLTSPRLRPLVILQLPLADVYGGHWSVTGRNVPDASTPDEAVYLPGRNPLLVIKARLWCQLHGLGKLGLGTLATNPFADASDDFFDAFAATMDRATQSRVELVRPLAAMHKTDVMQLGRGAPLEFTFSCITPRDALHCGQCNKCAERQKAFRDAGMPDRTTYAQG